MGDEPDIVKQLRDAEKLGLFQSKTQNTPEEFKAVEESPDDDVSNETVAFDEDDDIWEDMRKDDSPPCNIGDLCRTIVELSPDGIVTVDKKGMITSCNTAAAAMLNCSKDELIGIHFTRLGMFKKRDIPKYLKLFGSLLKDKEVKPFEDEFQRKDGTFFLGEIRIGFLKKNGKTVGFQVIIRDITERKRPDEELQESEMKYRELFEGSTNPITILGRDGFILMVNGVAARNLGLSPEACVGKSIFEMIPNLDNSLHELYQQIVDTGIEISREDCIELPSRGSRWFWSVNQPVSDINGRRYGVQIISYDITKRKKVEMELKEAHDELYLLNKDLEKKIQERTEKIRNQNEELTSMNEELTTFNEELTSTQQKLRKNVEKVEKLAEEKDDFIHMLGHDLKNPLTSINMLLPLIEKKEQDHELKEQLQVAILSVNQMKVLINETLKLARLNDVGGEIELGDIQLKDEVETVINNNLILINGNDIVVENRIDEKLIVRADKLQLDELLDNLIINAVKYIPDDKNGIVTINARAENDDFVKVSVKDTGAGLTSEQKTHVFDKFYKTGKPRSGMESSGLGLTICKRIVEKHGGQIWVESPGIGKGCTFYFMLKTR